MMLKAIQTVPNRPLQTVVMSTTSTNMCHAVPHISLISVI